MALFKTAEEKQAIKDEKEQRIMEKYGLQSLTNPDDIESVRKIISELAGSGLMETGALLSGNEKDLLKTQMVYQRTLVEQNFILIRQLDRLLNK